MAPRHAETETHLAQAISLSQSGLPTQDMGEGGGGVGGVSV